MYPLPQTLKETQKHLTVDTVESHVYVSDHIPEAFDVKTK